MGVDWSEITRIMEVSAMLVNAHTAFLLCTADLHRVFGKTVEGPSPSGGNLTISQSTVQKLGQMEYFCLMSLSNLLMHWNIKWSRLILNHMQS